MRLGVACGPAHCALLSDKPSSIWLLVPRRSSRGGPIYIVRQAEAPRGRPGRIVTPFVAAGCGQRTPRSARCRYDGRRMSFGDIQLRRVAETMIKGIAPADREASAVASPCIADLMRVGLGAPFRKEPFGLSRHEINPSLNRRLGSGEPASASPAVSHWIASSPPR